jgi:hypothetical protein
MKNCGAVCTARIEVGSTALGSGFTVRLRIRVRLQDVYSHKAETGHLKVKVKVSLCLTKHHAMKTIGGVEI